MLFVVVVVCFWFYFFFLCTIHTIGVFYQSSASSSNKYTLRQKTHSEGSYKHIAYSNDIHVNTNERISSISAFHLEVIKEKKYYTCIVASWCWKNISVANGLELGKKRPPKNIINSLRQTRTFCNGLDVTLFSHCTCGKKKQTELLFQSRSSQRYRSYDNELLKVNTRHPAIELFETESSSEFSS